MNFTSRNSQSLIPLSRVIQRVLATGKITHADEKFFLRALATEQPLTMDELDLVCNILNRMDLGLVRVVD
jgi:hypothetical protein